MRSADMRARNQVQRPECYEEVTLASAGEQVVLSIWHGRTQGAVVVFLPGTMTHPLFYEEFCDALANADITVVGLHYEGHGKSPRVRRVLRIRNVMTNVYDAIDYARERFGVAPVVIGSSQGGVLAMIAASGADLAGVVAHNALDPEFGDSFLISRFPRSLRLAYRPAIKVIEFTARVVPRLPIPFTAYLDIHRVTRDPWIEKQFFNDPLGRRSYPLAFIADLFGVEMASMHDGSIGCPVVLVAGSGDPLFSLAYTKRVFDDMVAPSKRLIVIDTDHHLVFNECLDLVLQPILDTVAQMTRTTATGGDCTKSSPGSFPAMITASTS